MLNNSPYSPSRLEGAQVCGRSRDCAKRTAGRRDPPASGLGGQVRRPLLVLCPMSWLVSVVLIHAATAIAAAHGSPSTTFTDPPRTAARIRTPSTPSLIPSRAHLYRRAEASGTHINEPPTPPGGFPPPASQTSTTARRPARTTTKPFPIGDNDRTIGQGAWQTGLDSALRDTRDEWNAVNLQDPREFRSSSTTTSSTLGNKAAPWVAENTADLFNNIWAPTDIPQPGDPVPTFPAAPTTQPQTQPPAPTAPTGPSVSLPQPTATPTFSAIPIVPIGLGSRTNSAESGPPLSPHPNHNLQPGSCGNGYCSPDESCSTCPLDCSLAHLDVVLRRRANRKHGFLFGAAELPSNNYTQYTFECGLPPVAQFCPRAPGTNRTRAMVAVTGQHPGPFTSQLHVALKGVPPRAVIVFLDLNLLMSMPTEYTAVACDLVLEPKFALGISLGSITFDMVDGVSAASLTCASKVSRMLRDWCLQREDTKRSLSAFVENVDERDALGASPLYIAVDPGSAYRAAVLDPSIPPLLASLNARLVVPSLPINEAHLPGSTVNYTETAADNVYKAIDQRPGISGWIVGFDGTRGEVSSAVIPRVVQELEKHVEWVSDVSECLEYDAKAGAKRAQPSMVDGVDAVKGKMSRTQSPVLKPNETGGEWAVETSVWGAEVEAVSIDDSHMPGGFFS